MILAGLLFFVGTTAYYYWQIKKGNGQVLFQKVYGGFTSDVKNESRSSKLSAAELVELESSSVPFLGRADAPVTIVEFVDFKCPNCRNANPILRQVIQKYGNQVKLVVKNFPVETTHPGTNQLSLFAMCANEQGYYWPVHNWFFDNQDNLPETFSDSGIQDLSKNFGLDGEKIKQCMGSLDTKTLVNKDYNDGYRFGIAGTPTFFVNGEKIEGVIPFEAWDNFLKNFK